MKTTLLFILSFLCGFCACAQKENNVWVFGRESGLDFNSGQPVPIRTAMGYYYDSANSRPLYSRAGFTSVCDRNTGGLLFYSDGQIVFDRNHHVMPNGLLFITSGINPLHFQSSVIVPFPADSTRYYLFIKEDKSANYRPSIGASALVYYVVDMKLNGGLGDVDTTIGRVILNHSYDGTSGGTALCGMGMAAVPGDHCDMWVISHEDYYPRFQAYHITESGVDTIPVVSPGIPLADPRLSHFNSRYWVADLAASSDGTIISAGLGSTFGFVQNVGYPVPFPRGLYLFRFDKATGVLSDRLTIIPETPSRSVMSTCFSADDSKLYAYEIEHGLNQPRPNNIVQYDVRKYDADTIRASRALIAGFSLGQISIGDFRAKGDSVYVLLDRTPFDKINLIHASNQPGALCDFEENAITLLPLGYYQYHHYYHELGADVTYPLPKNRFYRDTLICTHNNSWEGVFLQAEEGWRAYEWDNGITASAREIDAPGTYWVRRKTVCNTWNTDTFLVRHTDIAFKLPADTTLCNGEHFLLQADVPGADLLWQDGSKENEYTVTGSGVYWLRISKDGCAYTDTTRVTIIPAYPQLLGNDTAYCNTDGIMLLLEASTYPGAKVQWSTGSTEDRIIIRDSGVYRVRVEVPPCPAETAAIRVEEEMCDCAVQTPTAFSPNGDGRNDVFRPAVTPDCPVQGYSLQVFNRWGERVYQSGSGVVEGWDGMYKGRPAEPGVYYYTLRLEAGTERKDYKRRGEVTLVR